MRSQVVLPLPQCGWAIFSSRKQQRMPLHPGKNPSGFAPPRELGGPFLPHVWTLSYPRVPHCKSRPYCIKSRPEGCVLIGRTSLTNNTKKNNQISTLRTSPRLCLRQVSSASKPPTWENGPTEAPLHLCTVWVPSTPQASPKVTHSTQKEVRCSLLPCVWPHSL